MTTEEKNQIAELARKWAKHNLYRLDNLQQWITNRRNNHEDTRAFIVEFAGMPKAGKSGAIETLRHFFSHGKKIRVATATGEIERAYRIHTPAEGVSLRTPGPLKQNLLDFNSWAGAYALQELLQGRHDNYHDLVILDRGPWDAGCWLEYFKNNPKDSIVPEDIDKMIEFFQLPHWMTCADVHIVLTIDPAQAANRERNERLVDHLGPASNGKLMEAMASIYKNRFGNLQKAKTIHCPHIGSQSAILIDTTSRHPLEIATHIIDNILKVLELKIKHHAPFTEIEVWGKVESSITETSRQKAIKTVRDYVPIFVLEANALPVNKRTRLRVDLDTLFPSSKGVQMLTSRYEAEPMITELKSALKKAAMS